METLAGDVQDSASVGFDTVERPLWRWIACQPSERFVLLAFVVTPIDGILSAAGLYP